MAHTHTSSELPDPSAVLRTHGFRVTSARQTLLTILAAADAPLSVQDIAVRFKQDVPDIATLYRSLTDLHAAGVVNRVELGTGMAHFEYTPTRPHHHHIVCVACNTVVELEHCALGTSEIELLQSHKQFAQIYSHSLEFFGRCTTCKI